MNDLDPTVVNLAKAIRQTESGGDFNAKGQSGEHGGYQYTPDTWNAVAPKYGITSKLETATPQEQNAVTYNRIKEWKDSGKNVTQIASMWNAGEGEPDAYTGKFGKDTGSHKAGDPSRGVNAYGAKYDVPKYAESVANAYLALKNGGEVQQDPNNPSSVLPEKNDSSQPTFYESPKTDTPNTGAVGTNPNDSLVWKLLDNSVTRGAQKVADNMTFGGASQLTDETGKALNYGYQSAKSLLGFKNNLDTSEAPDVGKAFAGAGKTLAGVGLLAATGVGRGALSAANKAKEVLVNPKTVSVIKNILPGFEKMSATEVYDGLSNAKVTGHTANVVTKALGEILPKYIKENPELFSYFERNPKIATTLGFAKTGGKWALRKVADIAGLGYLSHLLKD